MLNFIEIFPKKLAAGKLILLILLSGFMSIINAQNWEINNNQAQGFITKIIVSNENNQEPGFSICVNDSRYGEVCMWRRLNSFNYQQLLDLANMAVIANKKVMIQANILGSLDSITVYN